MKNSRSILGMFAAALLVAALAPAVTFAGGKGQLKGDAHGPLVKAIDVIDSAAHSDVVKLDDDQQAKVRDVIADATAQAQAMQADRKANKIDKSDKTARQTARQSMMELLAQTKQRIEAVLTDTQKTAFRAELSKAREAFRAERQARRDANGDKPAKGSTTQPTA